MKTKYYGKGEYKANNEITQKIRAESIEKTKDENLNEWYATYYDAEFFINCTDPEYLLSFYKKRKHYEMRFNDWFKDIDLDNNVHLDIGFSTGKSLYWLGQKYSNIIIDTFDFNENCKNLFIALKELIPQIRNISIDDASKINLINDHYDSITALDFYEHVPKNIMLDSLRINFNALKPKGRMYLYLGKTIQEEHINLLEDKQTIDICTSIGFTFVESIDELLIFEKNKKVLK